MISPKIGFLHTKQVPRAVTPLAAGVISFVRDDKRRSRSSAPPFEAGGGEDTLGDIGGYEDTGEDTGGGALTVGGYDDIGGGENTGGDTTGGVYVGVGGAGEETVVGGRTGEERRFVVEAVFSLVRRGPLLDEPKDSIRASKSSRLAAIVAV